MAAVKIHSIKNLDDFVKRVIEVKSDDFLFRGQPCDRDLIPKLGRPDLNLKGRVQQSEQRMFIAFKKWSVPHLRHPPRNNWDWLAVAQHHGLPTRLLDWTTNPLAALWFAVERPCDAKEKGVVWGFAPAEDDKITEKDTDPFKITRTRVFQPDHLADRIRAQHGWFTTHFYGKNGLSRLNKVDAYKDRLIKFTIGGRRFGQLRHDLDRCGINHASIYADLDGVCRYVGWLNSFLSDEKDS